MVSLRRVHIAMAGGPMAAHAPVGIGLAKPLTADVPLDHVIEPTTSAEAGVPAAILPESLTIEGKAFLSSTAALAQAIASPKQFLREGKPSKEISSVAREWRADPIVLGTRGRSGLARLAPGRTAEAVVRNAPGPVLVVRGT